MRTTDSGMGSDLFLPEFPGVDGNAMCVESVQHCHPPKSVDIVDRILSDFRAGRQNVADFGSTFSRYVHIRYFAIRDEKGKYLGTVELTQDIAPAAVTAR
jgi:DUF438 domain-containing protein